MLASPPTTAMVTIITEAMKPKGWGSTERMVWTNRLPAIEA